MAASAELVESAPGGGQLFQTYRSDSNAQPFKGAINHPVNSYTLARREHQRNLQDGSGGHQPEGIRQKRLLQSRPFRLGQ